MSMGHDHDSELVDASTTHRHPVRADLDDTLTYYRAMEIALRELLIERGVLNANEIHRQVEEMDSRTPAQGARVCGESVGRSGIQEAIAHRR
jgi:nitrile hydratase subunit alpha